MWGSEERMVTAFIPPPSTPMCCTVDTRCVVVGISGTELISVVVGHSIGPRCWCLQPPNSEGVVGVSPAHSERVVEVRLFSSVSFLELDFQVHILPACQAVHVPQSVPELCVEVTKTIHIVYPVSGEVHVLAGGYSVVSSHYDQTATVLSLHVALSSDCGLLLKRFFVRTHVIKDIDTSLRFNLENFSYFTSLYRT